jgi:hypothetical protein
MAVFEGDWKSVPEAVEWAREMNAWVEEYKVYDYVSTDNGFEGGNEGLVDPRVSVINPKLVWTVSDSGGVETITPGFQEGDWGSGGVLGWYLSRIEWTDEDQELYSGKQMNCPSCEGSDESDCELGEVCESGFIFMYLNQTDFKLVK